MSAMPVRIRSFALLLSLGLIGFRAAASDFVVAERGRPAACAIVASADWTQANRDAARELVEGVRRLTGVELGIVTGPCPTARRIEIRTDPAFAESHFRLAVRGDVLTVTGDGRGVCYGVFELLERFGGVAWLTPDCEEFPRLDRFAVPGDLAEDHAPAIPVRRSSWTSAMATPAMNAHNRLNGRELKVGGDAYGGSGALKWDRRLHHCHTFKNLVPVAEFGKTHPEYFAMDEKGVRPLTARLGPNLCLTNPDVRRLIVERTLERVRENPAARYFGVAQNDTRLLCQCPSCRAVNARAGSEAGTLVETVNEVARAVAAVRPDAVITTLAYHATRNPPHPLRLEPNVMVVLCATECDFSAPLEGNPDPSTRQFVEALGTWRAAARGIYLYDYTMNFRLSGHAMPDVHAFRENVRLFRRNRVLVCFAEGASETGWFAELKGYVTAKVMWNPDIDLDACIDRFMRAYYGAAAPQARAALDLFENYPRDRAKHPMPYYDDIFSPAFPDALFAESARLWREAASAVAGDGVRAARVALAALRNDCTRVARFVVARRKDRARPAADDAYAQEMRAAAARIIAYERAHPKESLGWVWYKEVQADAYRLVGETPPGRDRMKFGEL